MRFVIYPVSGFCPWDPGETDELEAQNVPYLTDTPVGRWLEVARVSVAAVQANAEGWDLDAWHQFGTDQGLGGDTSDWFDSLYIWPILVSPQQWGSGRHRALLIERSGATHFAMIDPGWTPEWVND